ncbi:MAG TPA: urate hydroxylase PuuD [Methylomirabilota bacterium]|nr:urate hydroxylase PuuD [Methylomirabilota bacterium]
MGVHGVSVDLNLVEWVGLAVRWFHLVVAIGWIGASLYFMWLDASLEPPTAPQERVDGEVWMVHSGGFYHVVKRRLRPGEMPAHLHWFKWEAALTWASGFALLALVYYANAGAYLVDRTVLTMPPAAATLLGIALLAGSWVVYDLLWRSPLGEGRARAATWLSWGLLFALAWAACRLFGGRGAYIHVGAALGTIMVANVWMIIVPAQRELIAATREGREPDWTLGARAKRRSTHNSYVTLPVIFLMFSNHYPSTYGHPLNWLVLCLLIVAGAGVRHAMIMAEKRHPARWVWVPVAAAVIAAVALTAPAWRATARPADGPRVPFAVARGIVELRCVSCHSKAPTDDVFRAAPQGLVLEMPETIRERAAQIKERTVTTRTMPFGNKTGMTDEERRLLGRWVDQGARLQ